MTIIKLALELADLALNSANSSPDYDSDPPKISM